MKVGKCGLAYDATTGSNSAEFGLVLIHGWGCRHSNFDYLRRQLETEKGAEYRVIALDLPGHGETASQVLPTPSTTGFADKVLDLCREVGLKRIVLAGHSMGVRVAAEAWRRSLTTTSNLTVAGVVFLDGSHYKLRPSLFAFDNGDPRSAGMSEEQKTALKAEAFNKMFSPLTPQIFKDSTLDHMARMDQTYSQAVRDSMISYDREQMGSTIEQMGKGEPPLLNIQSSDVGPDNQRIPMLEGKKSKWMMFLEETVPQVRQVVITESAHFPHVDKPDEVAKAIDGFVRDVR